MSSKFPAPKASIYQVKTPKQTAPKVSAPKNVKVNLGTVAKPTTKTVQVKSMITPNFKG